MTLPAATQAHVFWRCLFIQAAWNRRGMQNLGFAFAIDPALRRALPGPGGAGGGAARHLGFFNCHPYMAAAIVGGAIHHEERVAAGEEPGAAPRSSTRRRCRGRWPRWATASSGPRCAPSSGAAAAVGALTVGWLPVVVALLLYNVHRTWRCAGTSSAPATGWATAWSGSSRASRCRARPTGSASPATALCGAAAGLLALRPAARRPGCRPTAGAAWWRPGPGSSWLALSRGAPLLPLAYAAMRGGGGGGGDPGWAPVGGA